MFVTGVEARHGQVVQPSAISMMAAERNESFSTIKFVIRAPATLIHTAWTGSLIRFAYLDHGSGQTSRGSGLIRSGVRHGTATLRQQRTAQIYQNTIIKENISKITEHSWRK